MGNVKDELVKSEVEVADEKGLRWEEVQGDNSSLQRVDEIETVVGDSNPRSKRSKKESR